ncbi:MAG: TIGR03118 family protein [Pyrinomonadaceae bacterium]|nr:TIGR03118 family protein [Pyrinomonadaceae bacterium]
MKNHRSDSLPARTLFAIAILFLLLLSGLHTASVSSAPPTPQAVLVVAPYRQTNLISDLPGVAFTEDPFLKNPWGATLTSSSPFWVVNNGKNLATLYKGDVAGSPLVRNTPLQSVGIETIPTVAPVPTLPTAVVANTTNDFVVRGADLPPAPTHFIFASEWGVITAWRPFSGSGAFVVKFVQGHMHTGLAIGSNASGNLLYAADFRNGNIDVFDKDFNLTSVPGNFAEDVPGLFHPFNIQNIGGQLYVTYAEFNSNSQRPNEGAGRGFVRRFNTDGVRDTTFAANGVTLNAPWGIALAPANFGAFSNKLLIGNFGDGGGFYPSIGAFDPTTGAQFGLMWNEGGANLNIDSLWSLAFGNGVNGGDPNTLYFTAGIFSERHGLFGSLKPVTAFPSSTVKFSATDYFVSEGAGHIDITVTRSGSDVSGTATVNYATVDGSAMQSADYEIALGKLTFNPGETSKTFRVLIVEDKDLAGGTPVDLSLVLSNATGAGLATPGIAKLFIQDNEFDTPGQPPNASDDQSLFVRQQYYDFLNRLPDDAGFNFWLNQITSCGSDQACIELKRINVSAAFFLSIEFQHTGLLAYLTEKAAFGGLPRYGPFMRDVQALQKDFVFGAPGADAQVEANKRAFFDEFITRPEFVAKYAGLTNTQYVFALFGNGQINSTTAELYIARLNGAQAVPPTGSPATGVVILRQALNHPNISVSLYLSGLTSAQTEAHIHGPATAGSNAPTIVTLPNGQFVDFQTALSNSQFLDLSRGSIYVDVHTTNFPNGEIRAQLPSNLFVTDMIVRSLEAGIITRAQALRLIAESDYFRMNELNRAFVLMEYFGYLRRNPDDPPDNNLSGYNFWLNKLNSFNGDYVKSEMVKAFIKSAEYRRRFGPP